MEERYHATIQNRFYPDRMRTLSICVFKVKYDGSHHATTQNRFYPDRMRTVSICVFKVKYDGREIPCDYTEPVLSR